MTHQLPEELLIRLSEFVSQRMGLFFTRERWGDLERGLRTVAPEFGFSDIEACAQWLLASPLTRSQIETLAGSLTVGETYFLREPGNFEALQKQILPEMILARRTAGQRLRVWSAGCCTGEEAYSIAILLKQLIPDIAKWDISLLATDINPKFLDKARLGIYGEWSFRNAPPEFKTRYFNKLPAKQFEIASDIKTMVNFSYLNLAENTYPSPLNKTNEMDVIFCRNVLMYFSPEQISDVIDRLYRSLAVGGWLVVSPTEASHRLFRQFKTVNFPNAILYQKVAEPKRPPVEPSPVQWGLNDSGGPVPAAFAPQPYRPVLTESAIEVFTPVAAPHTPVTDSTQLADALALYHRGLYAEAQAAAEAVLAAQPQTPNAMLLLARISANLGKLAEAGGWCEKAIAIDRLNAGAYYLQAVIYQEQKQAELAAQAFKRALYLDPSLVMAHFALGNLALQQGKTREADRYFDNTLSLLGPYQPGDILPEADGLTVEHIRTIIKTAGRREQAL